jgi:hypothetical protein
MTFLIHLFLFLLYIKFSKEVEGNDSVYIHNYCQQHHCQYKLQNNKSNVRFEGLIAVKMWDAVICVVISYSGRLPTFWRNTLVPSSGQVKAVYSSKCQ